MIGEVDYEIIVGVIHSMLAIMFLSRFLCVLSLRVCS